MRCFAKNIKPMPVAGSQYPGEPARNHGSVLFILTFYKINFLPFYYTAKKVNCLMNE